jgi:hypothetical protein
MGAHSVLQRAQMVPQSLSPQEIMELQSTVGNRAVQHVLAAQGPGISRRTPGHSAQLMVQAKKQNGKTINQAALPKDTRPSVLAWRTGDNLKRSGTSGTMKLAIRAPAGDGPEVSPHSSGSIQRKVQGHADVSYFQEMPFYNQLDENSRSYFDAWLRRGEDWTLTKFLDEAGIAYDPANIAQQLRAAEERERQQAIKPPSAIEATSAPSKNGVEDSGPETGGAQTTIPAKANAPAEADRIGQAVVDAGKPGSYPTFSDYLKKVTELSGAPKGKVHSVADVEWKKAHLDQETETPVASNRAARIAEMIKEQAQSPKTEVKEGPDDTVGLTVIVAADVRKACVKKNCATELDVFVANLSTGGGRTRGSYSVNRHVLQHAWLGSDASQAIFYEVDHAAKSVYVRAVGQHVGDKNKYSSFGHEKGFNFKNI